MKLLTASSKFFFPALVTGATLAAAVCVRGGLAIPYTPNSETLHLWHLNESGGPYAYDSADLSADAWPITLTNIGEPTPGTYPFTNTSLGNPGPGYPGLTNAYSGNNKYHLLYGGSYSNVDGLCNPTTGAFTFEALICMSNNLSGDYEIFTGDKSGATNNRGWQWRIYTTQEQWDLLGGSSSDNTFTPNLPTAGPDAVALGAWYHVAVTFTGQSPTNGDPASQLKLYWTLLDPSRTYADVLITENDVTNAQMPDGIRPLDGVPAGMAEPTLGIGGSYRSIADNPGNNEGLVGSLCEVRVTDLCLQSNQMAFTNGGSFPPTNSTEPPPAMLVGYDQPLTINVEVSASQPATYLWYQNGVLVAGQSNNTLSIPAVTFANGGSYYLITSNAYGAATSAVTQVTIGANADELFSTGIISNGVSSGDVPDPNYKLIQSSDLKELGPREMIWESNCPIEVICDGGTFAPAVAASMWISPHGNAGGSAPGDPTGTYTIRTSFLLDQTSPTNLYYQSGFECDGTLTDIRLNGLSTGFNLPNVKPLYSNSFTMSNYNGAVTFNGVGTPFNPVSFTKTNAKFFVPGLNTLDFVLYSDRPAIKVDSPTIIGYALPAGLPTILKQPLNATVRDANLTGPGSDVSFSVVATGSPPLSYQWYSNGLVMTGAATPAINITNPAAGRQGSNFMVVVANPSGSVTSRVATLTLVPTNQLPIAPNYTNYIYSNQALTADLSVFLNSASSPDGDTLMLTNYDSFTTNGVGLNFLTDTMFNYTPNPGFLGQDTFTYTIADSQGGSAIGTNFVEVIPTRAPTGVLAECNGNNVNISGSGGSPGGQYFILSSSSLLVPVTSWNTVATGTFDAEGSISISIPAAGTTAAFYVVAVP